MMQSLKTTLVFMLTLLMVVSFVLFSPSAAMENSSFTSRACPYPFTTIDVGAERVLLSATLLQWPTSWVARHLMRLGVLLAVVVLFTLLAQVFYCFLFLLHNVLKRIGLLSGHPRHAPPCRLKPWPSL